MAAAFVTWQPAQAADDLAKDKSSVEQVSFTTGKIGSRLKWVGTRRADSGRDGSAVRPTQCVTPEAEDDGSCGIRPVQELEPSTKTWSGSVNKAERSPERDLPPLPNGKNNVQTNPLIDKQLRTLSTNLKPGCPSPKDKEFHRVRDMDTTIVPSEGELPNECPLGDDVFQGRCFAPITYTWTASQLCHKPLYFEDVQLERYGHMAGPWVQPFASAANFFLTFPILPYKMGLELPNECVYSLGYYRPGDCAPYLFDPLPISVRGLFFEAGAWVGACAAFPGMGSGGIGP